MHRIETVTLEQRDAPGPQAREIDEHVGAFRRREEQFGHRQRRVEQPSIGTDEQQRQRGSVVASQSKAEDARVGTIQQTEAIAARRDLQVRVRREIDQRLVAIPAVLHVVGRRRVTIGPVGASVVQDQGDLGLARNEVERAPQSEVVVVFDDEQAEKAAIGLSRREAMGMRVVPVQAGAVAHRERVIEGRSGQGKALAVAVVRGIVGEPMPVGDRRLLHRVVKRDAQRCPARDDEGRVDVLAITGPRDERKGRDVPGPRDCLQTQRRTADGEVTLQAAAAGNVERPVETFGCRAEIRGSRRRCARRGAEAGRQRYRDQARPKGPKRAATVKADGSHGRCYRITTPHGNSPTGISATFLYDSVSTTATAFDRPQAT